MWYVTWGSKALQLRRGGAVAGGFAVGISLDIMPGRQIDIHTALGTETVAIQPSQCVCLGFSLVSRDRAQRVAACIMRCEIIFAFTHFCQERGMSRQDAEDVIGKMAKYDDFFVNLMMNEELGLQVRVVLENLYTRVTNNVQKI